MQFEIKMEASEGRALDFNYRYDLASALYGILEKSDSKLCFQLHDGDFRSRQKLFCFSGLNSTPAPKISADGDLRRLLLGEKVWMRFSSIVPEIAYGFADAIQKAGNLNIRDVLFKIRNISLVATPEFSPTMVYRPFGQSGMITCRYAQDGVQHYQYPDNSTKGTPSCSDLLIGNLRHKFLRLKDVRPDLFQNLTALCGLSAEEIASTPIQVEFLPLMPSRAYRTGLFYIKGTPVKAFRAPFRITAPESFHRILWECGAGSLNSQGFGLLTVGKKEE